MRRAAVPSLVVSLLLVAGSARPADEGERIASVSAGRVMQPDGKFAPARIIIEKGRVARISKEKSGTAAAPDGRAVDLPDAWVTAGWIDASARVAARSGYPRNQSTAGEKPYTVTA